MSHIHFLDPYQPRQSPIHKLDPRVKFVLALAFIFTAALTPPGAWPVYILLLAMILSVEILSELGLPYVLKRSLLVFPLVLAALPLIFTMEGPTLFSLEFGAWTLTISQTGLERFVSIALKSWISVQGGIVLTATTPFPELLVAMRAVKVPQLLVAIFGLMWRYLFILVDEAMRLQRARSARSGQASPDRSKTGGSVAWRARVTGGMAGNLFLRAIERSDRIYMAMISRGYDGEVQALPLTELRFVHWVILTGSIVVFGVLLGFAYLFWS